ncbi:MAG TPA: helix-turn-helix domain-containing protein [Acidimicrobiales bacterium]|nr:helix-turn-helix domain-containing protein [Acidimicrobiales bacterium]
MTRNYDLGERAKGMEETRQRILDAAWNLTAAAGFEPVSVDEIAAEAGVGRATIFRHFGSKTALYEAALWHRMSLVDLDRVEAAHQLPDPVDALAEVLRANCEMFDQIGDALARCLEVARTNDLMRQLLDISYFGRRVDSMSRLARRLHDAGRLAPGWTQPRVADALVVLTSLEAYETLTRHRARPTNAASDTLFAMAQAFLVAPGS